MNPVEEQINTPDVIEAPLAPKRSRMQEFRRMLAQNRLAALGFFIFFLFFCCAVTGLVLTSGSNPVFDPAMIRLEEKLRPPMSKPNLKALRSDQVPVLNLYFMGTDDLGRDVFARMLQGAWVSLTVGFVAVGISVLIGIFMGGMAGYFGQHHIKTVHILFFFVFDWWNRSDDRKFYRYRYRDVIALPSIHFLFSINPARINRKRNAGLNSDASQQCGFRRYLDHAYRGYHALLSELFSDFNGGRSASREYIQHYDRYRTDQLDGNHKVCPR